MLTCISLEIGRGHPNYLNSFLRFYPGEIVLIKREWKTLQTLYRLGAKGGFLTSFYNLIRQKGKPPRFFFSFLLKDLVRDLKSSAVVVSHPILAKALKDRFRVFYIHGEIAAPKESIVSVSQIFVPIEETKRRFLEFGIEEDKIMVTGLMIESELLEVAEMSLKLRKKRLEEKRRLTIAFFSSGAYPRVHIKKIVKAAQSSIKSGMRVFLFVGNNLRLKRYFEKIFPDAEIIFSKTQHEENKIVGSVLQELDCFVAPAHERTNWCCGLGLPLFCLSPNIGSYAPLNFDFAYRQGVSLPLNEERFGENLLMLRDEGRLLQMVEDGFGKFPIDGAKRTAEMIDKFQKKS